MSDFLMEVNFFYNKFHINQLMLAKHSGYITQASTYNSCSEQKNNLGGGQVLFVYNLRVT